MKQYDVKISDGTSVLYETCLHAGSTFHAIACAEEDWQEQVYEGYDPEDFYKAEAVLASPTTVTVVEVRP
jgi:hypothetical protein